MTWDDEDDFIAVEDTGDVESDIDTFGIDPAALGLETDGPDQNTLNLTEDDIATQAEKQALEQQVRDQQFGFTWRFDDTTGDLEKRGNGHVRVDELESFAVWVQSTLRTERGRYRIFEDDYGVDSEAIINGSVSDGVIPGFLEEEIKDALSMHNRFISLENYNYSRVDDKIIVTFTARTTAGEITLTTDIGA